MSFLQKILSFFSFLKTPFIIFFTATQDMNQKRPVAVLIFQIDSQETLDEFIGYPSQYVFNNQQEIINNFKESIKVWEIVVDEDANNNCYKLIESSLYDAFGLAIYFKYFNAPIENNGHRFIILNEDLQNGLKINLGRFGYSLIESKKLKDNDIEKIAFILQTQQIDSLKTNAANTTIISSAIKKTMQKAESIIQTKVGGAKEIIEAKIGDAEEVIEAKIESTAQLIAAKKEEAEKVLTNTITNNIRNLENEENKLIAGSLKQLT